MSVSVTLDLALKERSMSVTLDLALKERSASKKIFVLRGGRDP